MAQALGGFNWLTGERCFWMKSEIFRSNYSRNFCALSRARSGVASGCCLWNTFVTIGLAGAFLQPLDATAPQLTRSLEAGSSDRQLDKVYASIDSVDYSRSVLARMPERLIVLRDTTSGWTDLGSPNRVIDVLNRHGIRRAWPVPSLANAFGTLQYGTNAGRL